MRAWFKFSDESLWISDFGFPARRIEKRLIAAPAALESLCETIALFA
jgi:hypothetical protein